MMSTLTPTPTTPTLRRLTPNCATCRRPVPIGIPADQPPPFKIHCDRCKIVAASNRLGSGGPRTIAKAKGQLFDPGVIHSTVAARAAAWRTDAKDSADPIAELANRHVRGDFGREGNIAAAAPTDHDRALGSLAFGLSASALAIESGAGSIRAAFDVGSHIDAYGRTVGAGVLHVWTVLDSRGPTTLVYFTPTDNISFAL